MSWVLDGQQIQGQYFGIPFSGTVTDSRVKYGGKVQYTVKLDTPIQLKWSSEDRSTILVDQDEVVA